MSDVAHAGPAPRTRLAGYLFALTAGVLWGTTGPLSTALFAEGAALSGVGFWRIFLATLGFLVYGAFRPDIFRWDRRGLLIVGLLGGVLVAIFEFAYQYAIAGLGVAGAATLLYTAPLIVAFLAVPFLHERLTATRLIVGGVVLLGVALTVTGYAGAEGDGASATTPWAVGVAAGLLSAFSYSGTTLMARWAVPRYGAVRVLFLELAGGTLILALLLPLFGQMPQPASSLAGWGYIVALGIGAVLLANFAFFAGVKRIQAAPTAVAASIEPVVGALIALAIFGQQLTPWGWLGLLTVVGAVAGGYWLEAAREP